MTLFPVVLTPFQTNAKREIENLVSRKMMSIDFVVKGEKERFVTGVIEPQKVMVWIYEDGMEFRSSTKHRILERPDFSNLDSMLSYFVDELDDELAG